MDQDLVLEIGSPPKFPGQDLPKGVGSRMNRDVFGCAGPLPLRNRSGGVRGVAHADGK